MIDILIILQTHTKSNASEIPRYCGNSKLEVSKRCVSSLFNTIENCIQKSENTKYKLIVVDDHSDQEFLTFIDDKISTAKFPVEVIHLETSGIMQSIGRCYQIGKDHGKDLVYFAQDDYLYYETALWEMIDAYFQFTQHTGHQVCIFPYDDPSRYSQHMFTKILLGAKRHWRTAFATASCFLTPHKTIVDNWDLFEKMGQVKYDEYCEDLSINRLFTNFEGLPHREIKHLLFTPIPSVALHMGAISFKDPYINWEDLWGKFEIADKQKINVPRETKSVLNIGCGGSRITRDAHYLSTEDLQDYYEVRLDIDKSVGPDIISNIYDLNVIPSNTFNVVYSSHSLEHVSFHQIPLCLSEWYRVAQNGGEIRIVVPNMRAPAKLIVEGKMFEKIYDSLDGPIAAIDMIYGHRKSISENEFMIHKTGFTKESFITLLEQYGYKHFVVEEYETDIAVKIFKNE
jgi:ubiquinone/menaquinone biosynthesis C-methylase UbiE